MCVDNGPGEINTPSLITHANATLEGLGRALPLSSGCSHMTGELCDLALMERRGCLGNRTSSPPSPASSRLQSKWCDWGMLKGEPVTPVSSPAACHNAEMWQERSRHPNRRLPRDFELSLCRGAGLSSAYSRTWGRDFPRIFFQQTPSHQLQNGSTCSQLLRRRGHMVLGIGQAAGVNPHPPR